MVNNTNKYNYKWAFTVIVLVVLAAVVYIIYGTNNQKSTLYNNSKDIGGDIGALAVQKNQFSFGEIPINGGLVKKQIPLSVQGGQLSVKKIYTSCMCTNAYLIDNNTKLGPFGMHDSQKLNYAIASDKLYSIEITFDPAVHGLAGLGLNQRVVYIETNSPKTPLLEINFDATVIK